MKIGILQTGLVPSELVGETGEYPEVFARFLAPFGFDFDVYAVVNGAFPDGPAAADGWLITGSRHAAYEDHAWIPPLETLIRAIVAADRPLIGVCFGHQIIAQALGGRVEKFAEGWSIGPTRYRFGDTIRAIHAWHQDQVTQAPQGSQTIASSDFCRHAALLYPGSAYTVQPHPEFRDDYVAGLLRVRAPGVVEPDRLESAKKALGTPLDTDIVAAEFARFFRERRLA